MTADIVLDAIRDIRDFAEAARKRAGIASPIMTAEDYARFERTHFREFGRTEDTEGSLPSITGTGADDGSLRRPGASAETDETTNGEQRGFDTEQSEMGVTDEDDLDWVLED